MNSSEKSRPRRRLRLPRWLPYLALAAVLFVLLRRYNAQKVAAEPKDDVKTAIAARGDVRQTVSATGTLAPFTTVDVKSRAGGTILKMAVEEGTRVKQGQLIALIDRQDTSAIYRQAAADLDAARAALRQAEQNSRLQGAQIGPQIRQSAEGVANSRARVTQAAQSVVVQQAQSENAVREAQSGVASALARLRSAQEAAGAQPALSQASINQAAAQVEAARANLTSAQESVSQLQSSTQPQETASAQAQVAAAKSDLQTAETSLKRQQGLLERGFVAQNVVDVAQNQVVAARSALQTSQARLDTLEAGQSAALREARARVESSRGSLKSAEASLASARANTVQNRLKNRDVDTARAAVAQAQASLATAVSNRRQVALKQSDLDAAQASLRQSQAALQNTQAGAIQGDVRREDVEAARARLARAEVTAQNAQQNLEQTRVVAPRDGIVLQKYVEEGAIIQSGQSGFSGGTSIVQLAQVSQMFVNVQVDEADIALIEPGQSVDVALDAYPNSPKAGKVRKIFPQATTEQNVTTIRVQVEIDPMDVDERLRPAMNATCDFLVEQAENAITVPSEAVKDEDDGTTSVTVIKNPKNPLYLPENQVKKTVEVGVRGDELTEIKSGIKEGDTVVTQIISATPADSSTAGSASKNSGRGMGLGMPGMGGRR